MAPTVVLLAAAESSLSPPASRARPGEQDTAGAPQLRDLVTAAALRLRLPYAALLPLRTGIPLDRLKLSRSQCQPQSQRPVSQDSSLKNTMITVFRLGGV